MTLLLPPPLSPLLFRLLLLPLQDSESPKCLPKIPIYYLYKYWTRRNNYVTLFAKSFWNLVFAAFCTQNVLGEPPHDSFICTTTAAVVGTVSAAAEKEKRREWENKLLLAGLLVWAIFSPPPISAGANLGNGGGLRVFMQPGGGIDPAQPDECYFLSCPNPLATKSGGWSKRGGGEETLAVVSSHMRNNK